jgi:NAD(P)-dependent dehydrogenase (short-subunit alcohol dehydrogenase family)
MQTTMQNRICMVTGATSGMGKATASGLAQLGATVILVARNQSKGEAVRDEIRQQSGNEHVEVMIADLSSQKSIRELAENFRQKYQHLHVLVNNAGGVFFKRETTVDDLEMTFAVDHLAYFLLTNLLLDLLKASAPSRIINVSSGAEQMGNLKFDDLQREKRYNGFGAYSQAKLCNMLFSYELARRLEGTNVTVNAITPGPVSTNFGSNGTGIFKLMPLFFRFAKSPEDAAQTAIQLASAPELEGVTGKVFYDRKELHSSHKSHNIALQHKLWRVSEELTSLSQTVVKQ